MINGIYCVAVGHGDRRKWWGRWWGLIFTMWESNPRFPGLMNLQEKPWACFLMLKYPTFYLFKQFLKLIFIGVQLLYNIVLVSTVQQNIHITPPFWLSSHSGHPTAISRPLSAIRYVLIVICCMHNISSTCVSISIC